ncbi:MAG: TetR/AcrR family transcriptional regulator [Bacteroidia bacterium]|nr:TetR/AcrR family transcriptional regulator [Bacteroidia bacterium]
MSRPPADRTQLRERILHAALDLARERGWAAVSIRTIGERAGCASPIIYRAFQDKEAILLEVNRYAYRQLNARVRKAVRPGMEFRELMLAIAGAHWDFAFEERELHQVMYNLDGVHIPHQQDLQLPEGREVFALMLDSLLRYRPGLSPAEAAGYLTAGMALLIGFITGAKLDGPLIGGRVRGRSMMEAALGRMIDQL